MATPTSDDPQALRAMLDAMRVVVEIEAAKREYEAIKRELAEVHEANEALEEMMNDNTNELDAVRRGSTEATAKDEIGASLDAPGEGMPPELGESTRSSASDDDNARLRDTEGLKERIKNASASSGAEFEIADVLMVGSLLEDLLIATKGECELIFAAKDGKPLAKEDVETVEELTQAFELAKSKAREIADLDNTLEILARANA